MTGEYRYVWLLWASAFLLPWAFLYFVSPALRSQMVRVSAATSLLGLTEPILAGVYEHVTWKFGQIHDRAFA